MVIRSNITESEHHGLIRYIKDLRVSAPEQVDLDSWIVEGLISEGWIRPTSASASDPATLSTNPWPFVVDSEVDHD